ncbi:MAG: hypothetical protein ACE5OZ_21790 [Candidatus Heimdallarchaeota archaeon]
MKKKNVLKQCLVATIFLAAFGLVVNAPLQAQAAAPVYLTVSSYNVECAPPDNYEYDYETLNKFYAGSNNWKLSYSHYLYIHLKRLNNWGDIYIKIYQSATEDGYYSYKNTWTAFDGDGPYTYGPGTKSFGPSTLYTYNNWIELKIYIVCRLGAIVEGLDFARISSLGTSGTVTVTFYYPL